MQPLWRQIQRDNFTRFEDLFAFLQLTDTSQLVSSSFPLNLPRRLANKIVKGDLSDPILRQFLPHADENLPDPLALLDPTSDVSFQKGPRLLQKYQGRALLLVSSACPMHCRFCFRRHFPYAETPPDFTAELDAISGDPTLTEVILSGGDPLSLSNERLASLLHSLDAIPHLRRLRIHTRFPIGIPERLDPTFISLLTSTRLQVYFVLHTNHPAELGDDLFSSLRPLQLHGIPILTHSVLLRGVNDNVDTLYSLFSALVDRAILPYYINHLDPVQGATHFSVPIPEGKALLATLATLLPGYALPRYVQEIPHRPHKTLL